MSIINISSIGALKPARRIMPYAGAKSAVLYLASDASSFTTGANIRVDGGSFWDHRP